MESKTGKDKLLLAAGAFGLGALLAYKVATRPFKPAQKWTTPKGGSGGKWANINSHVSGVRTQEDLPIGKHPIALYSLGTPNGVKVTVLLEELCEIFPDFEYDAFLTMIDGKQFGSGFVDINPNSKIPALLDRSTSPPTRVFESGSILLYLCEKFDTQGVFLPREPSLRAECLNWVFWQVANGGYVGGGFGHFYAYAPFKIEYAIDRFTMELKRQLHVLNTVLGERKFVCGDQYTIADMAIWPWYGKIVQGSLYGAKDFISAEDYPHVARWFDDVMARPAVARGNKVNKTWGAKSDQLPERHAREDFASL